MLAVVSGLLLATALMAMPLPQRSPRPKATAKSDAEPALKDWPFRVGEILDYRASWQDFLAAATLRLAVREMREFFGRPGWHLQALATTIAPVRYLYLMDDQFDSYCDVRGLTTLQFEMYLKETRKNESEILRFLPEGDPAPHHAGAVRVPAGTRDPLSALYALRTVDWSRTPTLTMPVFDGRKLYELRAKAEGSPVEVRVMAGTFLASRIELRAYYRGKERSDVHITLWIAADRARTPVLIEAQMPFGKVRVELQKAVRE